MVFNRLFLIEVGVDLKRKYISATKIERKSSAQDSVGFDQGLIPFVMQHHLYRFGERVPNLICLSANRFIQSIQIEDKIFRYVDDCLQPILWIIL
jgi:hypothetical protein